MKINQFSGTGDRSSGFTLVEILVALVIIGLIAAIALPMYGSYLDRAKLTISINALQSVARAFEDYYGEHNSCYPPALDISTGQDGSGNIVLNSSQLADFNKNLSSLESYSAPTTSTYILIVRAQDKMHTLLTLRSGQPITQGP